MKARSIRDVNAIADAVGADGWYLVRECRHLLIEFRFGDRAVRQVMANSASDRRARANAESELRKALRSAMESNSNLQTATVRGPLRTAASLTQRL